MAFAFGDEFKKSPDIRPCINIGCLFDIQTGHFVEGKDGRMILNGGLNYLTGIVSRPNMFKSTLMHYMGLKALHNFDDSNGMAYDTEGSFVLQRMNQLKKNLKILDDMDFTNTDRFMKSDKVEMNGEKWLKALDNYIDRKSKETKTQLYTSPFIDRNGEYIKCWNPTIWELDSLSAWSSTSVENMFEKNDAGSSENNVVFMKDGAAKTQMLQYLPHRLPVSGNYMIMTAHIGMKIDLDPRQPSQKRMAFLKQNVKIKGVPEKFENYTHNCWEIIGYSPLINQTTKAPEFPRGPEDSMAGDTDLILITVHNLRGKMGASGIPFNLICSQSEGLLPSLSELYYLKKMGESKSPGWGMGGNLLNYYLEILPDVSLSRTKVRGKIDKDRKLRRALEITSELCQMKHYWHDQGIAKQIPSSMKTLYDDIKARGYDWDEILGETVKEWYFLEDKRYPKQLSTLDILNMRDGLYIPYWFTKEQRSKINIKPLEKA